MPTPKAKFLNINELIIDQGDIAVIIEEDPDIPGQFVITAYMDFDSSSPSPQDLSYSYLSACDLSATEQNLTASAYISCDSNSYLVWLPPATSNSSFVTDTYVLPTDSALHSPHTLLVPVTYHDTCDPDVE